jgi:hypothetical protein
VKIAYVFYWNGSGDGVSMKIATQIELWREAGHEVSAFQLTRSSAGAERDWNVFGFPRVRGTRRLAAAVADSRPDLVYLRYDLFVPPLRRLVSHLPSVIELNESGSEYRLRGRAVAAYDRVNRRLTLGAAEGLVGVTNEIVREQSVARPAVVIGNGIDLRRYEQLPPSRGERPRAVFLGSSRLRWHGVDKITELANLLQDVDFDVIGPARANVPSPPPNLHVHGHLPPRDYRPLLARADVGIGTLAYHRTDLHEGSPLKTREYLAYGLPVVIAYQDTDFADAGHWFICELANDEANVREGAGRVRTFIESMRGRRVPRADVADRIDAAAKERRRLEFFAELLSSRRSARPERRRS